MVEAAVRVHWAFLLLPAASILPEAAVPAVGPPASERDALLGLAAVEQLAAASWEGPCCP